MTDSELVALLRCPYDRKPLMRRGDTLCCESGHSHYVYRGIPVLLRRDVEKTLEWDTLQRLDRHDQWPEGEWQPSADEAIHPGVQRSVGATSGSLYRPVAGRLTQYPIPEIRLPAAYGERLLDIGCGWGRWTIAASRKGYDVVSIDPQLGFALIAAAVCRQLGINARFVVADARHLPFADSSFDRIFSYSVIQHFSKSDAKETLSQVARVLRRGGRSLIQMPNKFGLRSAYHQMREHFRPGGQFRVRYWSPSELDRVFSAVIGRSKVSVDGFFGLGVQPGDLPLLPFRSRIVILASEFMRKLRVFDFFADSLYVSSEKTSSETAI